MKLRIWVPAVFCATALSAQTQNPRAVLLEMELNNSVVYMMDVADPAKRALDPGPTTAADLKAFNQACQIDDIVAVNRKPAQGLHVSCSWRMGFSPTPAPGWGIADAAIGQVWPNCNWELLSSDGRFVGRFVDGGFFPHSVLGGAGAYLGAQGEHTSSAIPGRAGSRTASAGEDPSRRRAIPGGGTYRVQYYLIPATYPGFEVTARGVSVFHSDDSSLVTEARPARPGELLVARALNLGPTTPYMVPGQAFPAWPENPLAVVNSDVEVTVNGLAAEVVNKVGSPGEVRVYRIDFRVPAAVQPGSATLQLTSAWIPSDEVRIPVR